MTIKNFGLNIKLTAKPRGRDNATHALNYKVLARQAQADFAFWDSYEEKPKTKPLPKAKPLPTLRARKPAKLPRIRARKSIHTKTDRTLYRCKTYLCNWQGEIKNVICDGGPFTFYCPCCGKPVFEVPPNV
jgi:hypothetical protein